MIKAWAQQAWLAVKKWAWRHLRRGIAAVSGLLFMGRPLFVWLNYQACIDAGCSCWPSFAAIQPSPAAIAAGPLNLRCPNGHPIIERRLKGWNTITTVTIDCVTGLIFGNSATFTLKPLYLAVGTSSAATTDSTTTLTSEFGRVAVSGVYRGGLVGSYYKQAIIAAFLGPSDGNCNQQEFALMAGAATGTANSGIALARIVKNQGNKDSSETLTIVWTISGAST